MIGSLDGTLDFYRQALAVRGYRQEVLSADIANASTPGFKAVDVDFAEAMKNASAGGASPHMLLVNDARQMQAGGGGAIAAAARAVKYQSGTEVSLDGNSVDLDHEKTAAAENAVDYEAVATFTSQTLKMLSVAINGGTPSGNGA
ncbi:MAG TPA: flagellar basal body rod protein FlgB [Stellaceae bacterium]|nr:flagellar basal body rod protein FlgB [Stellaceae bacterium]